MSRGGKVLVVVKSAIGGGLDVVIDDEGAGLDEAARSRLFEPFFTTKSHGTGLGLAITRQIIEAHSGSIACEPRKDVSGTRVWVHLPAEEPASSSTSASSEARATRAASRP
jgi:signal transduction histidine kinase